MPWQGGMKMWSKFDFNDPYEGEVLESINNTPIPQKDKALAKIRLCHLHRRYAFS